MHDKDRQRETAGTEKWYKVGEVREVSEVCEVRSEK